MDLKVIILSCIYLSCIGQIITGYQLNGISKLPKKWDQVKNSQFSPRIHQGATAVAGEFRGKISIQTFEGTHLCGGTLIHERHVLTSAFCVTNNSEIIHPSSYRLMGDDLTISVVSGNANRQIRTVTHVFVHPEFNFFNFDNNLAVMRSGEPFTVSPTFNPVSRPDDSPISGTSCSVAGWGRVSQTGGISFSLLRVDTNVISRATCNSNTAYNGLVRAGMFCASPMSGLQGTCEGDDGGGLICNNIVAGIVSWGHECDSTNFATVYVDVSVYNFWIDSTIAWNEGEHENVPTPTPTPMPTTPTSTSTPTPTTTTPIPENGEANILNSMYPIIIVNIFGLLLLK